MQVWRGVFTALITPMRQGAVDEKTFEAFVQWQIAQGVHGLVPCGTTGESPTLSHAEHDRVVSLCVEVAAGRVPVLAGAGSNSTREAIRLAQHAQTAGADGVLVVSPYYNKPSQEGLYAHFRAVHDAIDIPLMVYNIPSRSVVDVQDDTLARLAELPRVAGVKDATGNLARVSTLRHALRQQKDTQDFVQFSGEDMTALAFNAAGGQGCISVAANVAPDLCAQLQEASLSGDFARAHALQDQLIPLHAAMFCEPSPAPVKYALSLLDRSPEELRLPLVGLSEAGKEKVRSALRHAGVWDAS